jgi:hypothetical protein
MLVVAWRSAVAPRAAVVMLGLAALEPSSGAAPPPPPHPDTTSHVVVGWSPPHAPRAALLAAYGNLLPFDELPSGELTGAATLTLDASGTLTGGTVPVAADATAHLIVRAWSSRPPRAAFLGSRQQALEPSSTVAPDATAMTVIAWRPQKTSRAVRYAVTRNTLSLDAPPLGPLTGAATLTLDASATLTGGVVPVAADATSHLVVRTWSSRPPRAAFLASRQQALEPSSTVAPDATAVTVIAWRPNRTSRAVRQIVFRQGVVSPITVPTGALDGSASLVLDASGVLTVGIPLAGSADLVLAATADLTAPPGGVALEGAATLALASTASLSLAMPLTGSAALTLTATAFFDVPPPPISPNIAAAGEIYGSLGGVLIGTRDQVGASWIAEPESWIASPDSWIALRAVYRATVTQPVQIQRRLTEEFFGFPEVAEVSITLRGASFAALRAAAGQPALLWRYDRAHDVEVEEFRGLVDATTLNGDQTATVRCINQDLSVLDTMIPKRLTSTTLFGETCPEESLGLPIPKVIGTVRNLKLDYVVDDVPAALFVYRVAEGACTVTAVRRDRSGGLAPQPLTPGEYQTSTTRYPGITVVITHVRQESASGGFHTLYADVTSQEPEERNPAHAFSAVMGDAVWGLGLPVDAAWNGAEATLLPPQLVLDGAIGGDGRQRPARDVLRDILMVRGGRPSYDPDQGWRVSFDSVAPSGTPLSASSTFSGSEPVLSEGGAWTNASGPIGGLKKVAGALQTITLSTHSAAAYTGVGWDNNQSSEVVRSTTGTAAFQYVSAMVRMSSLSNLNGYAFTAIETSGHQLYKITAGVFAPLGDAYAVIPALGDTLKLEIVGTTLTPYINGVPLATRTDATYPSGSPGIHGWSSAAEDLVTSWTGSDMSAAAGGVLTLHDGRGPGAMTLLRVGRREQKSSEQRVKIFRIKYALDLRTGNFLYSSSPRTVGARGKDATLEHTLISDRDCADRVAYYYAKRLAGEEDLVSGAVVHEGGRHIQAGDIVTQAICPELAFIAASNRLVVGATKEIGAQTINHVAIDPAQYTHVPGVLPPLQVPNPDPTPPSTVFSFSKDSDGTYQANDGATRAFIILNIVVPVSPTHLSTIVDYRRTGTTVWGNGLSLQGTGNLTARIDNLVPALAYDYRARTQNRTGTSVEVTLINQIAPGDTTAPSDLGTPTIHNQHLTTATFAWAGSASTDWDRTNYDLRTGANGTGTVVKSGTIGGKATVFTLTATEVGYGTARHFRVQPVDRSGNLGNFTSSVSVTFARVVSNDIGDGQVTTPKRQILAQISGPYSLPAGGADATDPPLFHGLGVIPNFQVDTGNLAVLNNVVNVTTTHMTVGFFNMDPANPTGTMTATIYFW